VRFEGPHVGQTTVLLHWSGSFFRGFPRRRIVPAQDASMT
jgi:hypothetical protein